MDHSLTDEEKAILQRQHKAECDGRVRNRIKAVLLRDKGMELDANRRGSSPIRRGSAFRKLKLENGGSKEKLPSKQSKCLVQHLTEHT